MATDLINTRNAYSGEEELADLNGLRALLAEYETDWHAEDAIYAEPDESDLTAVIALRERLRSVFETASQSEAAAVLNEVLLEVGATPRISLHGVEPHLHFEPQRGRVADWLGAATAVGLSFVLVDHGLERFGTCAAHDCDDAYVDTSRNRSRRHCSTTCGNRDAVAAHRARSRAAGE